MDEHSKVVGGSTAKRVLACPGSVALVDKMPPQLPSAYAEEGSMLHKCMDDILRDADLGDVIAEYKLSDEQAGKLAFCIEALDAIDPDQAMIFRSEARVSFEADTLAGVFGTTDLIGRLGDRAIILDWKFGDGVMVEAEDNPQGLFYAAAAMETPTVQSLMEGCTEVEIVIVQPPHIRRWVTTPARVSEFKHELARAVRIARQPDAPIAMGDHCRFCPAKPICPQMTGAADRLMHRKLELLDAVEIGRLLQVADQVEEWTKSLRELAFTMLENDKPVPGYKLVAKRAVRRWVNDDAAIMGLMKLGVPEKDVFQPPEVISPAQAEKILKKSKVVLPDSLVVAVSSGSTLAPESDPRPAVLNVGKQLTAALSKLQ